MPDSFVNVARSPDQYDDGLRNINQKDTVAERGNFVQNTNHPVGKRDQATNEEGVDFGITPSSIFHHSSRGHSSEWQRRM